VGGQVSVEVRHDESRMLAAGQSACAPRHRGSIRSPGRQATYAAPRLGYRAGRARGDGHIDLWVRGEARQTWRSLAQGLAHCRTATITITGKKATATIRPLPFPRVASTSSAYAWAFTTAGIQIGFDLVLFETGADTGISPTPT